MPIKAFKNHFPKLSTSVYVDDSAVIIGNVNIGEDVSIWPMSVVRGDVESITIGAATNIQDGSVLHVSHAGDYSPQGHPLTIGRGVTVGHKAVLHACTVGDYCLIGVGAVVMDDAVLEDYVMIGAGGLVPPGKKLESGYLYVGSPVRQIRALKPAEKKFLEYSAHHYVELKNAYLEQNQPVAETQLVRRVK